MVLDYWWKYRSQTEDGTCEAAWLPGSSPTVDMLIQYTRNGANPNYLDRAAGFYSFRDPLAAFLQMKSEGIAGDGSRFGPYLNEVTHTVLGTIWQWGVVAEHEIGYRSQFASVRGIDDVFPRDQALLSQLRELYGVQGSEHAV